jgi:hypothetical protein
MSQLSRGAFGSFVSAFQGTAGATKCARALPRIEIW